MHISSEVEPFFKTGGMAVVASALPRAEVELGHTAMVIAPYFKRLIPKGVDVQKIGSGVVTVGDERIAVEWYRGWLIEDELPVYFISHKEFFDTRKTLYGGPDANRRFYFFGLAALELLRHLDITPDIIHCHDWQSGLVPYFIKNWFGTEKRWKNTASVFTIHNLTYQFGHDWWTVPHENWDDGYRSLPEWNDAEQMERINFAKRAILSSDVLRTVSETYREEIMTRDFGEELHRILKNREKLIFGIVNGIDYDTFNPLTDPGIYKGYSEKSLFRKALNKRWLQKHYHLKIDPAAPMLCSTSRMVEQKGFRLLIPILTSVLELGAQCVIMGDGDEVIIGSLKAIERQYPKQLRVVPFDAALETSLYAGADLFLLPSRFEPCGINQLIALRYGCIPIVNRIGGLADTISNYDPATGQGNGFAFKGYTARNLLVAIVRAMENYRHKRAWRLLMASAMVEAYSWRLQAHKYIVLYNKAKRLHRSGKRNRQSA